MVRERENTMQASSLHFLWIIREQYILIVSVSVQLLLCKLIRYSLKNNFVFEILTRIDLKRFNRKNTLFPQKMNIEDIQLVCRFI